MTLYPLPVVLPPDSTLANMRYRSSWTIPPAPSYAAPQVGCALQNRSAKSQEDQLSEGGCSSRTLEKVSLIEHTPEVIEPTSNPICPGYLSCHIAARVILQESQRSNSDQEKLVLPVAFALGTLWVLICCECHVSSHVRRMHNIWHCVCTRLGSQSLAQIASCPLVKACLANHSPGAS